MNHEVQGKEGAVASVKAGRDHEQTPVEPCHGDDCCQQQHHDALHSKQNAQLHTHNRCVDFLLRLAELAELIEMSPLAHTGA